MIIPQATLTQTSTHGHALGGQEKPIPKRVASPTMQYKTKLTPSNTCNFNYTGMQPRITTCSTTSRRGYDLKLDNSVSDKKDTRTSTMAQPVLVCKKWQCPMRAYWITLMSGSATLMTPHPNSCVSVSHDVAVGTHLPHTNPPEQFTILLRTTPTISSAPPTLLHPHVCFG